MNDDDDLDWGDPPETLGDKIADWSELVMIISGIAILVTGPIVPLFAMVMVGVFAASALINWRVTS